MQSVGDLLKAQRIKKKLSREKLERHTKIKKEFIEAIENGQWKNLPEFPVVWGFIKNISTYLGLDQEKTTALLKRDYLPKDLKINPNPDIKQKFSFTPRFILSFLMGVFLIILTLYLFIQYRNFVNPPKLIINIPQDEAVVEQPTLKVVGETDTDASVLVNNQPASVDGAGFFEAEIEIYEGTDEVSILATSPSGKKTLIVRRIFPKLK